jgi:hypothetical protein
MSEYEEGSPAEKTTKQLLMGMVSDDSPFKKRNTLIATRKDLLRLQVVENESL